MSFTLVSGRYVESCDLDGERSNFHEARWGWYVLSVESELDDVEAVRVTEVARGSNQIAGSRE